MSQLLPKIYSQSRFAKDNNVSFEFHETYYVVKSQISKQILLKGVEGANELYSFKDLSRGNSSWPASTTTTNKSLTQPITYTAV